MPAAIQASIRQGGGAADSSAIGDDDNATSRPRRLGKPFRRLGVVGAAEDRGTGPRSTSGAGGQRGAPKLSGSRMTSCSTSTT